MLASVDLLLFPCFLLFSNILCAECYIWIISLYKKKSLSVFVHMKIVGLKLKLLSEADRQAGVSGRDMTYFP